MFIIFFLNYSSEQSYLSLFRCVTQLKVLQASHLPTSSKLVQVSYLLFLLGYCFGRRRCSDEVNPRKQPYKISNQRLRDLGMEFTPAAQALYETVICFQEKGILPVPATATPSPSSLP